MRHIILLASVTALFVAAGSGVRAQTAVDPTGHWEGTALVQQMELPFAIDLVRSSAGDVTGSITVSSQHVRALPLIKVSVDGRTVHFEARTDQPFTGTVADDGRTMSGEMTLSGTGYPVRLTRTGDAQAEPPLTSAPIAQSLEGTWNGTLDADGGLRLVLDMRNHADGTATGTITNLDEGDLRLPVAIAQRGDTVTLAVHAVPITFTGTLSADGATLTGLAHENGKDVPVTFRKSAGGRR